MSRDQGRRAQKDPHVAVIVRLVPKGVLDAVLGTRGRVREDVVAHCDSRVAVEIDIVVAEHHPGPALSAVDGEAVVLAIKLVVVHRIRAHKVGHCILGLRAKRVVGRPGWLEEHLGVAIAVQYAGAVPSGRDEVTPLLVHLGNANDGFGPRHLRRNDVLLGDVAAGGYSNNTGNRGRAG